MAQPSVSRFIANLEEMLGVRLFVRENNRVALTAEGKRLYEATALGFGHIRAAIDEISATSASAPLMICCTHSFANLWVLPRIHILRELLDNREVRITTAEDTTHFITDSKQLVVRFGSGDWTDGDPHLLCQEEVFPVCTSDLASRYGLMERDLIAEDLAELPLLVQDRGEYGWLSWPSWFNSFGGDGDLSRETHVINNYAFALQAAMEGKGIALAWRNLVEPHLSNGWLLELPGLSVTTENGYYLVVSSASPVRDVVCDWIAQTAS